MIYLMLTNITLFSFVFPYPFKNVFYSKYIMTKLPKSVPLDLFLN